LIDAMGYIFRAYFAPMDRLQIQTAQGTIPTKVPYLFANMVRKLIRDHRPDYIAVVLDVLAPTFRDKLFTQYKAQRPPMPADLSVQMPYVRRYCEAMRLPMLECAGYEADDLIGSLARQATEKGLDTLIVTSDKDLMQLVGGRVRLLNPAKGDLIVDAEKVQEIMGVPPHKVPDVMALMGDSIDNIPGARDPNEKVAPGERRKPGIGDVGAKQLIQQFGSAEECLKRAAEVKRASYREALQKNGEFVLLSKQLSIIPTDAPIELDLNALKPVEPDNEALRELFAELKFTTLLKEMTPAPSVVDEKTDYAELGSAAELEGLLGSKLKEPVAVWIEVDAAKDEEPGYGSKLAAFEFSASAGQSRYLRFQPGSEVPEAITKWREDSARPKIVHDPKLFEIFTTPENNGADCEPAAGIVHATELYSYLIHPTTANHSLPDVVLRQLNRNMSLVPGEHADMLTRLAPVLRAEVERLDLLNVYETIDLPLAPVLARMERHGVRVSSEKLHEISERLEVEVCRLEKEIHALAGFEFKVNSPQQLAEVLFDKLGLSPPRRGRMGKVRSTAADILEELALIHDLPRRVIEYREMAKLKSTYADALPELIHPKTGRIHTRFSQTTAATGRLSSSNPNLQNIPIRTEVGREIRASFIADKGNVLLSADYSQIELRLLAHYSEDPVLVEAFQRGEDIHSRTAQEVFQVGPMYQNAEHRRAAKVINFGIVYGLSAFGLSQNLGIPQKEAAEFIAAYFARYKGVKRWLEKQVGEVRQTGITRTLFGRVRPIPEITSPQVSLRNFAERTAMNTPLQGTASDLIKLAMIKIDAELQAQKFKSRMILQVHDELLFEGPPKELSALTKLVKTSMEEIYPLRVPLVVDLCSGPNWRDLMK
jgi:DNA polymerase I